MKSPPFLLVILIALIGFSCSSNDDDDPIVADTSIVLEVSEVNQKFEDLDNLTLAVLENAGIGARKSKSTSGDLCASTNVTNTLSEKTIVIDFGEGCTSPNGLNRKGKILITYSGGLLIPGAKIVTTFEGYEVNGYKIEGTRTITNTKLDINQSKVTLSVTVENGKVTFPEGGFVTVTSDRVREITLSNSGYEASITGTASGISTDGSPYTASVTDELKITQSCIESGVYIPISGLIEFTYKGFSMSLDYGTGDCDKDATIIYPGGVKNITFD